MPVRQFEIKLGLCNGYVNSISRSIQPDKVEKISKEFPDLNIEWLITGIGEMLKPIQRDDTPEMDSRYVTKLLPVSAMAGSLGDFSQSVTADECELTVCPIPGADFIIPITGESMAPEYPNGSRIAVKKINDKAFIEWGKVYVLDTCNGAVVKEIRKGKDEDELECVSLNPDPRFAPFVINRKDVLGMYRVLLLMAFK